MEYNEAAKQTFLANAHHTNEGGEPYLTLETFVDAVAPLDSDDFTKIGRNSFGVLFDVADRRRTGKVFLRDWLWFDTLLDRPDAEFQVAYRLFDREGSGYIDFDEFVKTYNEYKSQKGAAFDWNGPWAALYIGQTKHRHRMTYSQFCQMLNGLAGERVRQYFLLADRDKRGFISPEAFEKLVNDVARHKLSDSLLAEVHTVINRPASRASMVSYATVRAFFNMINRMEVVEQIALRSADDNGYFTKEKFSEEAARVLRWGLFTPLEIDLVFHFAGATRSGDVASLTAFRKMFDPTWRETAKLFRESQIRKSQAAKNIGSDPTTFLSSVFASAYNFTLGSIAGAFGATMVYPIDLVKTRMQNQRKTEGKGVGGLKYLNSWDCFKKVLKFEGFRGLYSGLLPQLIGVAPEKAIKLTVNDLVRGLLADNEGNVPLTAEILAGGSAGACQVVFTNPLEIVKIRLQVQGEAAVGAAKQSAGSIMRQLGITGLYKGATACLMRDVPFSAIYFPSYAHLKRDLFHEEQKKRLSAWELLTAGAIAGIPAAYLTTPFDVIKTRLQVAARNHEEAYTGVSNAARRILREEGFSAFFKGGVARILRSSPQFGFTLAAYEVLKRFIPYPGSKHDLTEAGHVVPTAEQSFDELNVKYLRSRNALKLLLDIDENFGLPLSTRTK